MEKVAGLNGKEDFSLAFFSKKKSDFSLINTKKEHKTPKNKTKITTLVS